MVTIFIHRILLLICQVRVLTLAHRTLYYFNMVVYVRHATLGSLPTVAGFSCLLSSLVCVRISSSIHHIPFFFLANLHQPRRFPHLSATALTIFHPNKFDKPVLCPVMAKQPSPEVCKELLRHLLPTEQFCDVCCTFSCFCKVCVPLAICRDDDARAPASHSCFPPP